MGYPVTFMTEDGKEMARINKDGSLSVQSWDMVRNQCHATPASDNLPMIAFARVFWAAKDNFYETPWEVSNSWHSEWGEGFVVTKATAIGAVTVIDQTGVVAQLNLDGSWSVNWNLLRQLRHTMAHGDSPVPHRRLVLLRGLLDLLWAARDNFVTTPFPPSETSTPTI